MKTLISTLAFAVAALPLASCNAAPARQGSGKQAESARGWTIEDHGAFDEPWAMAFEPGTGNLFVTERGGTMKFVQPNGRLGTVTGLPRVDYGGQGGLGDVAFAPDYATSRLIYLSWAEAGPGKTNGAAVGRARLVCEEHDSCRLDGLQVIWRQAPKVSGHVHYSHRLAFSPDGRYLFVSSGERFRFTPAQDLTVNLGKIVRLLPDGRPAPGNPFAERGGVAAQIWSYGHRNVLGLAFDARGSLWDLEHGPQGGDELNRVEPGRNYGWPVVSYGDNYDGTPIPRPNTRPDMVGAVISWNPVIAPGDFIWYSGALFPAWKGNAIIAGMVFPGLVRVEPSGLRLREAERIDLGHRIREIEQGPDGAIWVLEDGPGGRLRKIVPRN